MNKSVDVLAITPHPDDVEMICGGTMVKLRRSGYSTGIIDLTGGELGTRGSRKTRAKEAKKASEILGASFRKILDHGDGSLTNNDTTKRAVVKAIRECKPKLIITTHWFDDHPDHVACAYIVKDAVFLSGVHRFEPEFESHHPHGLIYGMGRGEFQPAFIIDITNEFEKKMESITAFESQFYKSGSDELETQLSDPEFLKLFEIRGRFFGRMIGCSYGEPFFTKYPPQVLDPVVIWGR